MSITETTSESVAPNVRQTGSRPVIDSDVSGGYVNVTPNLGGNISLTAYEPDWQRKGMFVVARVAYSSAAARQLAERIIAEADALDAQPPMSCLQCGRDATPSRDGLCARCFNAPAGAHTAPQTRRKVR